MATFPYSYYRCPCADVPLPEPGINTEDTNDTSSTPDAEEDEKAFNPHDARSNFALFPLEHLMWCEVCHEIRCSRCVIEQIVCWFCPGCGFEVASSMVKSEGNRCTRNCYNCPSCTAGLFVNSMDTEGAAAPWIFVCEHCDWTSLDIGIIFEKPNNIHGQLAKILGKTRSKVMRMLDDSVSETPTESTTPSTSDPDARFAQLLSFYKSELSKENPSNNPFMSSPGGPSDYNSPSSFARIMSMYTNTGNYGRKASAKAQPMRGAETAPEGLAVVDRDADEAVVNRIRKEGLMSLTNTEQRINQPHNPRFQKELLPQATLLATKTSRRCRTCRHILVKPEPKVSSTRYKIKLVALNHIPSMTLKPLLTGQPSLTPLQQSSTHSIQPTPAAAAAASTGSNPTTTTTLPPNKPLQFALTLHNPLFEELRVTLGTPTLTPGRHGHKVTILCPQFSIGANADLWDDALGIGAPKSGSGISGSITGATAAGSENRVAEAGKIWERGRNWTSVVLEVICQPVAAGDEDGDQDEDEDADVLEIPLFVRVQYEQDSMERGSGAGSASGGLASRASVVRGDEDAATATTAGVADQAGKAERVKRELAYWVVIGAGRVGW